MKTLVQRFTFALVLVAGILQNASAVTFTTTPSTVSNTYNGPITLQISGVNSGDTVVVQKFLDLDANGVVNPGDYLVQQFNLTDGQATMVIGGVTNLNVPGDMDGAMNGQITATMNFQNGDFSQSFVGTYLLVLSSPAGHFPPVTNSFAVTNFPFPQTITGSVLSNGVAAPGSVVIVFLPPGSGDHGPGSPQAGTVANNSGVYTLQVPPGTYIPLAFKSSCVGSFATAPMLTLGSGQTITTNLQLTNATATISGQIVDINNSSIGLPGVFLPASTQDARIAVGFSDTNGNFSVGVASGNWSIGSENSGLIVHGYVGYQNGTNVAAGTAGIVGTYSKATAMFYGSVKDNLGNPIAKVDLQSFDNYGVYQADGYSDTNGNYFVGIVGGLGTNDPWQLQVSGHNSPTNYIYSQPAFDQSFPISGTNLAVGQALQVNITALPLTGQITGNVQFNGTNLVGLSVFAYATINGASYNVGGTTDANGNYAINVANGTWSVGVSCNGGNDSLDGILGPGNYQCPNNQNVIINNNGGTANFAVQTCNGIQVLTTSPLPVGQLGDYYSIQFQASSCSGNFNWSVNDPQHLPPGMTLYSGGAFNGAPTTNGTFSFSVHVSDGGGNQTNQSFSLTIVGKPVLGSPSWHTNQFQLRFTGAANQNYTFQMSTNLAFNNWVTLYVTNNPVTNSFLLIDPNATNKQRFYRILVGP